MCSNLSLRSYGNVNNINVKCVCVWFSERAKENLFEMKCASKKPSNTCEKIHIVIVVVVDVLQLNYYETSYELAKNEQRSKVFNYLDNNKKMIHKHAVNFWLLSMLCSFYSIEIFHVWMLTLHLCSLFILLFGPAYGQIQIRLICSRPSLLW